MRAWWDVFALWTILLADLVVLLLWLPLILIPALRTVRSFRLRDVPDIWSPFGMLDRLVSQWWTPELARLGAAAYVLMPPLYLLYAVLEAGVDSVVFKLLLAQTVISAWTGLGRVLQWRERR